MTRENPPDNGVPKIALITCSLCAIAISALFYPPLRTKLLTMEHQSSDWRAALLCDRTVDPYPGVVIVAFDLNTSGTTLPIPRDLHAKVIRAIDAARPLVIGLDFYFVQATNQDADRDFISAIKTANTPVVVGAVSERADQLKDYQFQYQDAFLSQTGRPAGYINLRHDDDDVVRFTSLPVANSRYPESFARIIARLAGVSPDILAAFPARTRIAWLWGANSKDRPFVTIPAQEVLLGKANNKLEGKVVLTGIDLPYQDQHRTPLSVWTDKPTIGVIIHAQMIAQLIDARRYSELAGAGREYFLLVIGLLGCLLSWWLWRRPRSVLGLGVATAALVTVDAMSFGLARLTLPIILALYVWFVAVTAGHHLHAIASWAAGRLRRSADLAELYAIARAGNSSDESSSRH
jgi:CHASE2 domain-containing sensor protein